MIDYAGNQIILNNFIIFFRQK